MKKNGFTLIELLAVIVILAIIALIATPIILNIINGVKKSATDTSKEAYLNMVDDVIMMKNLTTSFSPSSCTVRSNGDLLCDDWISVKVEMDGEKPCDGQIVFKDGVRQSENIKFCDDGGKANSTILGIDLSNESTGQIILTNDVLSDLYNNTDESGFDLYFINDGTKSVYLKSVEFGEKVCTPKGDTTIQSTADACNNISLLIQYDTTSSSPQIFSSSISDIKDKYISSERILKLHITFVRADADGPFNLDFGNITFNYGITN